MSERDDLLERANELGLEFPKNVKTSKLETMIAEASGEPVPLDETPPPSPAVKTKAKEEDITDVDESGEPVRETAAAKKAREKRLAIQKRKQAAFKTQVVTITNRDNRDNDVTSTAYLSFENQYFGLSKVVPLDIPVELEQALIDIAESTMITHHRDEIIDGRRTGNKVAVPVKKYTISYGRQNQEKASLAAPE